MKPKATTAMRAQVGPLDPTVMTCLAVILGLGLVLVYSSSAVFAARNYGDAEHFLKQQVMWLGLGIVAMFVASRLPGEWLRKRTPLLLGASILACVLVLIPGIGTVAGGARRWLAVGGLGFQPSEVAKVVAVLMLAAVLARNEKTGERSRLWVPVLVAQIPVLLILAQPDLGTALVIELMVLVMVFVAGLRLRYIIGIALAALPVFYHLVMGTPFRLQRLLSYIDPWAYRSTTGYQVTEALISIGSGGVFGVGLGEGKQKLFFLPEAHTDFIFAILGEELGLVGIAALLCVFAVLLVRGTQIAVGAKDSFDAYLAIGVTALLGVPLVFNVCVVTGLLPTKGLPLPLVSKGGSNLVATLAAVGLLLRIARDQAVPSTRTENKA